MRIALGSSRAAKVAAVRAAAARVASIDARWGDAALMASDVETDAPAMPLTDEDLVRGARARALAVQALVSKDRRQRGSLCRVGGRVSLDRGRRRTPHVPAQTKSDCTGGDENHLGSTGAARYSSGTRKRHPRRVTGDVGRS